MSLGHLPRWHRADPAAEVLDLLPQAVVACDADGTPVVVNQAARELLGPLWRDALDALPLARAAAGEHVRDVEVEIRSKGEHSRVVTATSLPLADPSEPPVTLLVLEALCDHLGEREDRERLAQSLADGISEGVALIRVTDGMIVYTTPSWDRMFGHPSHALEGHHISEVTAAAGQTPQERAREVAAMLAHDGSWQGDAQFVRKSGSTFWCEVSVSEFDDPTHGRVWIVSNRDMTARREIENQHHAVADRLQAAFERSPAATMLLTADWRLVDVNEAFGSLFGYAREELLGRPLADITHPDDVGLDAVFGDLVFSGAHPVNRAERRYLTQDGSAVPVIVDARLARATDGRAPYAIATITPKG